MFFQIVIFIISCVGLFLGGKFMSKYAIRISKFFVKIFMKKIFVLIKNTNLMNVLLRLKMKDI